MRKALLSLLSLYHKVLSYAPSSSCYTPILLLLLLIYSNNYAALHSKKRKSHSSKLFKHRKIQYKKHYYASESGVVPDNVLGNNNEVIDKMEPVVYKSIKEGENS